MIHKADLRTLYVNAVLGDGRIHVNKNGSIRLYYYSTSKQLIDFKESVLNKEGHRFSVRGTQRSGYGSDTIIYNASTAGINELASIHKEDISEILEELTELDLFLWYIDDGSWHISRNTMHLYSNSLDLEESKLLIERIKEMAGIKPNLRVDKKADGREFYYLYFPRALVKEVRGRWLGWCKELNLTDYFYKFGGLEYKEPKETYFTETEVRKIRKMNEFGYTGMEISRTLGYEPSRIYRVISRETYKDVM